jgi:hypothetical protein
MHTQDQAMNNHWHPKRRTAIFLIARPVVQLVPDLGSLLHSEGRSMDSIFEASI